MTDLNELSIEEMNNLAANDACQFFKSFLGVERDFEGDDSNHPYRIFDYNQGERYRTYINRFYLKIVDEDGGYEGGGESVMRVVAIVNEQGNKVGFIQLTGSYYSYQGISWDNEITQVYPRQVTLTKYFAEP